MNYNHQHMYELCKKHMHSYVLAEMNDGAQVDGIITGLDDEYVYMAVPLSGQEAAMPGYDHHYNQHDRQFGFGYGYGYPGFYGGYGYPGYGRPRRRFSRLVLPLAALAALSVLPWY